LAEYKGSTFTDVGKNFTIGIELAADMVRFEFDLIMVAGTTAALARDSSGVTLPLPGNANPMDQSG
jgi:hypothetical protein